MKFLNLAASDHGGAGVAAWRLHDALRKCGHESSMIVLNSRSADQDVSIVPGQLSMFRVVRLARKIMMKGISNPNYYFHDQSLSPHLNERELLAASRFHPDIIIVHSISHFLAFEDVRTLHKATGAPIIWNLLDMALMTGGCHYAWDCRGYMSSCHGCPALRLEYFKDLASRVWLEKLRAIADLPGVVIAGSTTLAEQARSSSLLGRLPIETLLLGVSPEQFKPRQREFERGLLGINRTGKLIFFGAQRLDQKRKGMDKLLEALSLLKKNWSSTIPLPKILSAGDATDFKAISSLGFEHHSLGFVNSETLSRAYAASDLFVCPSIQDSGPMMINESLMCGTPVVAFRMGVAPDLIFPGVTGEIAELGNPTSLANCIMSILMLDEPASQAMALKCREIALQLCSPHLQAQRVIELSEQMRAGSLIGS